MLVVVLILDFGRISLFDGFTLGDVNAIQSWRRQRESNCVIKNKTTRGPCPLLGLQRPFPPARTPPGRGICGEVVDICQYVSPNRLMCRRRQTGTRPVVTTKQLHGWRAPKQSISVYFMIQFSQQNSSPHYSKATFHSDHFCSCSFDLHSR